MSDSDQDAVAVQLAEMRGRLLHDAATAGTPEATVVATIDDVEAGFVDARVTSFLAVLVEREVRTRLRLPSHNRPALTETTAGAPGQSDRTWNLPMLRALDTDVLLRLTAH